jgi:hypothetical protein
MAEPSRSFAIKLNIDNDCRYLEKPKEKNMFRKKATPWVMAMAMMGMTGVSGAQTIDKNWVRQNADNPRDARGAISYANNTANVHERINASPTSEGMYTLQPAEYYKGLGEAAQSVGAPHVDMITNHDIPRSRQSCWEAAAWSRVGDHSEELDNAIRSSLAKYGLVSNALPHMEWASYPDAVCGN